MLISLSVLVFAEDNTSVITTPVIEYTLPNVTANTTAGTPVIILPIPTSNVTANTTPTVTSVPTSTSNVTAKTTPTGIPVPTLTPNITAKTMPTPAVTSIVKEQVKCIFKNAATPQKCYTAEDNSRFYCIEGGTCLVDVTGNNGERLTWKSTCGGYAYTIIDGNNEYVEFNCLPEGNTTIVAITGKGFRYAYWQCYNNEEQKHNDPSSCKSSETWQKYAKDFCNDKCYEDGSKCGVNSFSVSEECYLEFEKEETIFVPSVEEEEKEQKKETVPKKNEEILICKDSCPLNGKCYPFGYRKSEMFCSDKGSFVEQLKSENSCENNFECSSNVCVNGNCISSGLMEKIINWFTNIFG